MIDNRERLGHFYNLETMNTQHIIINEACSIRVLAVCLYIYISNQQLRQTFGKQGQKPSPEVVEDFISAVQVPGPSTYLIQTVMMHSAPLGAEGGAPAV